MQSCPITFKFEHLLYCYKAVSRILWFTPSTHTADMLVAVIMLYMMSFPPVGVNIIAQKKGVEWNSAMKFTNLLSDLILNRENNQETDKSLLCTIFLHLTVKNLSENLLSYPYCTR